MSERGKRVVRVLLDRERDADVVERIERQGSITGYLRMLVRRDIHDERIDYAAMKAAELQAENEKLREQTELLITLLRNDCDIEASWDGLRKFWSIGLTESGCLMRDRACKAEAENAKLRERIKELEQCIRGDADGIYKLAKNTGYLHTDELMKSVNNRLRELGVEV